MFSIITPLDPNRLEQFKKTKRAYDRMPQEKEFIIPTRHEFEVARYLDDHKLMRDVTIIPYTVEKGFNVSKALNIGVRKAKYENVIITSPEVLPLGDVLHQLSGFDGENVLCKVYDEEVDGKREIVLVSREFRSDTPAMYFLAQFQKSDIKKINGWDEDFMKGYAYEDNDFGERWVRAGIPFKIVDEIRAVHQYHERGETIEGGTVVNQLKFYDNTDKGIIRCKNGLELL